MSQKTGQLFCLVTSKQFTSKFNAVVSMPPATASANNKNLQIAFVGRIIAPYTWSGTYSRVKDILSGIYFSIDEIICLNPKTGQRWKVDIPAPAPLSEVFISPPGVDSSEEDLKRQTRVNPRDGSIYLKLGKIYFAKDELDLAIVYLKTALIWDDSLIDAHSLLGEIYIRKGQCAEAKERINSALKLNDNNPAALSVKKRVEKCVEQKNRSNV
jgi:outer membrane protein assembly factor BamB